MHLPEGRGRYGEDHHALQFLLAGAAAGLELTERGCAVARLQRARGFGSPGLDRLVGVGIAAGATTLLLGPVCGGKALIALHYVEAAVAYGKRAHSSCSTK